MVYLVVGYFLAWASELSSIHTGFPYGLYIYIPATKNQELWFFGVPFMDSLSYVFLTYASYSLAKLLLAGWQAGASVRYQALGHHPLTSVGVGAILFTLLDVVIDPLSLRGYRWFLGQIYGYPDYGSYFGVPLSNFGGWLLVGFIMIAVLQRLEKRPPQTQGMAALRPWASPSYRGTVLYFGVLLFNVAMTFAIGEMILGVIAVSLLLLLAGLTLAAAAVLTGQRQHALPEAGE